MSARPLMAAAPQVPPYETGLIFTSKKCPGPQFRDVGRFSGDHAQAHRKDSFWEGMIAWSAPAQEP